MKVLLNISIDLSPCTIGQSDFGILLELWIRIMNYGWKSYTKIEKEFFNMFVISARDWLYATFFDKNHSIVSNFSHSKYDSMGSKKFEIL